MGKGGELSQLNSIQELSWLWVDVMKVSEKNMNGANLGHHQYSRYRISSRPPLQHCGPFRLRHVDSDEVCQRLLGVLFLFHGLAPLLVSHRVSHVMGGLANGVSEVKRSDVEDVDTIHRCYLLNLTLLVHECAVTREEH